MTTPAENRILAEPATPAACAADQAAAGREPEAREDRGHLYAAAQTGIHPRTK